MSDESMVGRVAKALEASFKATVADSAEMPFEETGVFPPKPEVWQRYARAAIEAVRTQTQLYDGPLNEAGWAMITALQKHAPVEAAHFNNMKPSLKESFKAYFDAALSD